MSIFLLCPPLTKLPRFCNLLLTSLPPNPLKPLSSPAYLLQVVLRWDRITCWNGRRRRIKENPIGFLDGILLRSASIDPSLLRPSPSLPPLCRVRIPKETTVLASQFWKQKRLNPVYRGQWILYFMEPVQSRISIDFFSRFCYQFCWSDGARFSACSWNPFRTNKVLAFIRRSSKIGSGFISLP